MEAAAKGRRSCSCPVPGCSEALAASSGSFGVSALSEHLEQQHRREPTFKTANKAKPWRCPGLCQGSTPTFATSGALAKHLIQKHGATQHQAAPGSASAAQTAQLPAGATGEPSNAGCLCGARAPRPKLPRGATGRVLLCSWNLEHFSTNMSGGAAGAAAGPTGSCSDSRLAAEKLANVAATLRHLAATEGAAAPIIVALQEVLSADAVTLLAQHLTATSGRAWAGVTSDRPLGRSYSERAAFLWSDAPPSDAKGKQPSSSCKAQTAALAASPGPACAGTNPLAAYTPATIPAPTPVPGVQAAEAHTHVGGGQGAAAVRHHNAPQLLVDPHTCFQLLSEEDFQRVVRESRADATPGKAFLRSPYFGLFRLGAANLLVANVHLAAEAAAARAELAALDTLAAAIERPNPSLFRRRRTLLGWLRGRAAARGLLAVVGDFNCPMGRVTACATCPVPQAPAGTACTAGLRTATAVLEAGVAAPAVSSTASPAKPGAHVKGVGKEKGKGTTGAGTGASGGAGGGGPGQQLQGWEAFLAKGWVNALGINSKVPPLPAAGAKGRTGDATVFVTATPPASVTTTTTSQPAARAPCGPASAPQPAIIATNWRAKELKSLDAVCVRQHARPLVIASGVCPPPPYIRPEAYPNHLLCWVALNVGPLQGDPGKVRQLAAPRVEAAG